MALLCGFTITSNNTVFITLKLLNVHEAVFTFSRKCSKLNHLVDFSDFSM